MKVAIEKAAGRRRSPSQNRSTATVAIVLDAAEDILEKKGLNGFNTNAVAERAGVSVGSVYQYFSNKNEIISALIYRSHQVILEYLLSLIKDSEINDAESALTKIISHSILIHRSRPNLVRILEIEEARLPRSAELNAIENEISTAMAQLFSAKLNLDEIEPRSMELIVTDVLNIIRVMTVPSEDLSEERLHERIYWALQGYLEKWKDRQK